MPNNFVEQQSDIPDVTISIGEVNEPQPNPLLDDFEANDGIFQDYWMVFRYEKDKQRWMMPVCSPNGFDGDSVAFVQLAADTLLLVIDWTAEKAGQKPSIPKAELSDPNWILLDDQQEPAQLQKKPSGEVVFRISGCYVYGSKNPSQAILHYPRPPWMSKSKCEHVDETQYQPDIIECEPESMDSTPEDPAPEE